MFSSSSLRLKHIAFLGSGAVNSSIASFILSKWYLTTSSDDQNDNNNKITFITRDAEAFKEDFIAEHVPQFLSQEKGYKFLHRSLNVKSTKSKKNVNNNDNDQDNANNFDAVFCAAPLHHVHTYVGDFLKNHSPQKTKDHPPIFLLSRGLQSTSANNGEKPILKEENMVKASISTNYHRRIPNSALASQQKKKEGQCDKIKQQDYRFWCASNIVKDLMTMRHEEENKNEEAVKTRIYALGGLLTPQLFKDATSAMWMGQEWKRKSMLSSSDTADPSVVSMENFCDLLLEQAPPLVLGCDRGVISENEEGSNVLQQQKQNEEIESVRKLLEKDLGLTISNRVVENLEDHALLDALLVPAALGGGIVKANTSQSISGLLSSSSSPSQLRSLQHQTLSNFHQRFTNDCLALLQNEIQKRSGNNSDSSIENDFLESFSSTIAQACNCSHGYTILNNIPEFGRKVVSFECEIAPDAEAKLFAAGSGHGEALQSTLETFASLASSQTGGGGTNSFVVLADFFTGFHTPELCAKYLMMAAKSRNGADEGEDDGDFENDEMKAKREHFLMPDLRRLDEAVEKGTYSETSQMAELVQNVTKMTRSSMGSHFPSSMMRK